MEWEFRGSVRDFILRGKTARRVGKEALGTALGQVLLGVGLVREQRAGRGDGAGGFSFVRMLGKVLWNLNQVWISRKRVSKLSMEEEIACLPPLE